MVSEKSFLRNLFGVISESFSEIIERKMRVKEEREGRD